jgi:mono/diheme cytochrome c family protein
MKTSVVSFTGLLIALALVGALRPDHASAEDAPAVTLSSGRRFVETDGEAIYRAVCQSCHMADGQGAQGAGTYPALARNPRLAGAAYPVYNILHGRKAMPAFGPFLNDQQVAEVTGYVRTHFGNDHPVPVSAADVKALR